MTNLRQKQFSSSDKVDKPNVTPALQMLKIHSVFFFLCLQLFPQGFFLS